jgi:hypothetical protein
MIDSINADPTFKRELEHLRKLCVLPALCMLGLVFAPAGSPWLVVVLWLVALCLQLVCCGLIWRTASRLQRSGLMWAILAMGFGPLGLLIAFVRLDSLAEKTSEPARR